MQRNFHSAFSNVTNYINVIRYLYRYENQEHIDKFFDTGELLISSFHQYSQYKDNQLGDGSEGSSFSTATSQSNDLSFGAVSSVGHQSYCFCTSTVMDKDLFKTFGRNSVFRIKDPINFILEVERSLTRVREVLQGNCIYLDKRIISKQVPNFTMDTFKHDEHSDSMSMDKMMGAIQAINGPEQYFLKLLNHQKQSEYRILWNTDREVKEPLVITCPEAIKFCEKVEVEILT